MDSQQTNKEAEQKNGKPKPTLTVRVIGWIFFVLAFIAAYLLVRKLMSR